MTRLRALSRAGPTDLVDAGALLLTAAVVVMAVAGAGGVTRAVLALAFVTFVPGWAVVGRTRWMDGAARVALAVGISLAAASLGATAMAWLHAWSPIALLAVLASGSTLLMVVPRLQGHWRRERRGTRRSIWVGQVELSAPPHGLGPGAGAATTYETGRILVRLHGHPLGFVTLPLSQGRVDAASLGRAVLDEMGDAVEAHLDHDRLPAEGPHRNAWPLPAGPCRAPARGRGRLISVVVCTRDRPGTLACCLDALQRLRYPRFEVVVVDNAPAGDATAALVRGRAAGDPRLRYVCEPRPGLSRARNRGLAEAQGEVVAFTDDDAIADEGWLAAIDAGFDQGDEVACVTGLVPAAELDNEAQKYFDERVSWGRNLRPRLFDMGEHRLDSALYPYSAGKFGTGANFAFERGFLLAIGGFDEALGAGSRSRGGEDLDAFVRTLHAGRAIFYQPSAIAWHVHRAEAAELRGQMFNYGLGFAAFATKYLIDRRTAGGIVWRAPWGLAHLAAQLRTPGSGPGRRGLALMEVLGMAAGPGAYLLGRRAARR